MSAMRTLATCTWCDTVNLAREYRCIVCDTPLGLPVIDSNRGQNLDLMLRNAVIGGGVRYVATAFSRREIEWRNSRLARKCLQLALAEEFASFDFEFQVLEDQSLFVGWKWPEAPFVNAVSILSVRGAKIVGRHIERRGAKANEVAVNLQTARDVHIDQTEYFMSLRCYIDANMVPMAARRVWTDRQGDSSVEHQSKVGR